VACVTAICVCVGDLEHQKYKIRIYKTLILPVVLYGCENWSLTQREDRRLRVFENRALRKIFEPKRGKITVEYRSPHNEELNDLTPHQILFG
jgi:hypothetical protein